MTRTLITTILFFSLSACGNEPTGKSTTKLDAVEVQPGSISDSMILLDDASSEGTAVDNSVPDDRSKHKEVNPAENPDENTSADAESESKEADADADAEEGQTISGSVAKKARTDNSK